MPICYYKYITIIAFGFARYMLGKLIVGLLNIAFKFKFFSYFGCVVIEEVQQCRQAVCPACLSSLVFVTCFGAITYRYKDPHHFIVGSTQSIRKYPKSKNSMIYIWYHQAWKHPQAFVVNTLLHGETAIYYYWGSHAYTFNIQ